MGRGSGRGGGGGLTKLQSVQSGAGDDHHAPTVTPTCRVDAQKRANQRVLALLMEQASLTQENLQLMEVCQVADSVADPSRHPLPTVLPVHFFCRGSPSIYAIHLTDSDLRDNTRRSQVCRDQ